MPAAQRDIKPTTILWVVLAKKIMFHIFLVFCWHNLNLKTVV